MMTVKFVGVSFQHSTQVYDFKTDLELENGDVVVCETERGLQVGAVVQLLEESYKATKWIIDKVDMSSHQQRIIEETQLKELRKKMERRRKQLSDMMVYEQLAKEDPEMKELLDKFKSTNSGILSIEGGSYE